MTGVVHIAGIDLQINNHLRQRCAWCGAVLVDYALDRLTGGPRPTLQERTARLMGLVRGTWPVGDLIEVDGPLSTVVPHVDGDQLPAHACSRLDPDITS